MEVRYCMSSSRSFFPWVFGVVGPDLFSDALVRIKGRKLFAETEGLKLLSPVPVLN